MQVDEVLAQECGHETSPLHTPPIERTAGLALEKGEAGRSGSGLRTSEQVVVLLVRKAHQGK